MNERSPRPTAESVFINCPFDETYRPIRDAIVFVVIALRFQARTALESDSGTEERLKKIMRLIAKCRFGIDDLSAMGIDERSGLPRYNMAFELGLFLGCCEYESVRDSRRSCLILDREPYRYQKSLSDLSGRDIKAHHGEPLKAMAHVRDWLNTESGRTRAPFPGAKYLTDRYKRFRKELPRLCQQQKLHAEFLTFNDYLHIVQIWLELQR